MVQSITPHTEAEGPVHESLHGVGSVRGSRASVTKIPARLAVDGGGHLGGLVRFDLDARSVPRESQTFSEMGMAVPSDVGAGGGGPCPPDAQPPPPRSAHARHWPPVPV